MQAKAIPNEEIQKLPLMAFEGKIIIADTKESIARAFEDINRFEVVGVDTETKPVFKKGLYNHVALLQVAIPDKVYLIRLHRVGFTREIIEFFCNGKILKIGISLDDDLKNLKKRQQFKEKGFVDLNYVSKEMGLEYIGVKNLAAIFLRGRISKKQQVSNWENEPLTEAQKIYAATDAWVCIAIFNFLEEKGYIY